MVEFVPEKTEKVKISKENNTISYVKIFLWLGLGLLVTGVIALGMPDLLNLLVNNAGMSSDAASTLYMVLLIVGAVLMIPSIIIMNIKSWKPKSVWMKIGYFTYCVGMGLLLSNVFMYLYVASVIVEVSFVKLVSTSFLTTAGCFLIMALFGMFTKKNLNFVWPLLATLCVGILVISLINFFLGSSLLYWILDFVIFGMILITTAVDLYNIKKIASRGTFESTNNLAIYCAYVLYVDFINIFIRVLYYVLIVLAAHKK